MTRPLRSTGITHYYGAVRPSPARRYFRPRGWSDSRLLATIPMREGLRLDVDRRKHIMIVSITQIIFGVIASPQGVNRAKKKIPVGLVGQTWVVVDTS
jgi:hypothetical protein